MSQLPVSPKAAEWAIRALARGLATWGLYVSVAILLGSTERFGGPSMIKALELPGAPPSWGASIGLSSACLLAGSLLGMRRLLVVGALANSAWAFFFALSYLFAQFALPTATVTGFPTYLAIAVANILVVVAHQVRFETGTEASTWSQENETP